MTFPTATDLAWYQLKRHPAWASRIKRNYSGPPTAPNIDHVINAHAGTRTGCTEAANMIVFVQCWIRQGDSVVDWLQHLANIPGDVPNGANPRKRRALARKWAARIQGASP